MNKLVETEDYVVYDDVLETPQFEAMWNAVQQEEYLMPHISGWSKVWRLTDGTCIGSRDYDSSKCPIGNWADLMNMMFTNVAHAHANIIPKWANIIIRSYLYPRGTKLSWHNDLGYAGAAIYYVHPEWASTWGGELFIAKTPDESNYSPPHLDHRREDSFMAAYGVGTYITCKPNRLVLTRPGVWHSINRVDDDAGDHCRASVVGFFKENS
jgi:hypothetical protein